jgi:hypothetical protein
MWLEPNNVSCCLLSALPVPLQGQLGNRWAEVARHIPGRTGQQCAQRWRHTVSALLDDSCYAAAKLCSDTIQLTSAAAVLPL